jgi:F-type H+-transporting ATPase subunit gamma
MAKARALDRRRKAVRSIRKITRTMELIATARFKAAMDRAQAAAAYTRRIRALVADLGRADLEVSHPLLEPRPQTSSAKLLALTANRGYCGGYNASIVRLAMARFTQLGEIPRRSLEVSGKRGAGAFRFRGIRPDEIYTHFENRPRFEEVELLANRYLEEYLSGRLDRLEVAYMKFESASRQRPVIDTLLPLTSLLGSEAEANGEPTRYEFLPSAQSILEEVVPTSFKVQLFQCFLDAAVGEQIARMVAMKAATENADSMIGSLSMSYNRARQGQITGELLEIMGGAEALGGES